MSLETRITSVLLRIAQEFKKYEASINGKTIGFLYWNGSGWAFDQTGPKGEPGEDGYSPHKGLDYFDGATPYIGSNGNWYLMDWDTGVQAKGDPGDAGQPGQPGANGYSPQKGFDYFDGATPYIGENGNWFLVDWDTGVHAKGDPGNAGLPGINGYNPQKDLDYFDGATPYIGANGNWFLRDIDTGVHAQGEPGTGSSTDTAMQIKEKLETLSGEGRLSSSSIHNTDFAAKNGNSSEDFHVNNLMLNGAYIYCDGQDIHIVPGSGGSVIVNGNLQANGVTAGWFYKNE